MIEKAIGNRKGYSLIELMAVVAIIGILAALAVPSMSRKLTYSKQSEVKANLMALFVVQEQFFPEQNVYCNDIDDPLLGWKPEGRTRYHYFISGANQTQWSARATGNRGNTKMHVSCMRKPSQLRNPFGIVASSLLRPTPPHRLGRYTSDRNNTARRSSNGRRV